MLTRCPACQTTFRVSPEQLAARAGRVRCGHCLNAFNALQNGVADQGEAEQALPETPLAEAETPPIAPAPREEEADFSLEIVEEAPPEEAGEPSPEEAPAAPPEPLPAVLHTRSNPIPTVCPVTLQDEWSAAETLADAAAPEAELMREAPASELPVEPLGDPGRAVAAPLLTPDLAPETPAEAAPARPPVEPAPAPAPKADAEAQRRHLGMAVGCLVALLAIQGVFLLRHSLSQAFPSLRPPILALCERLGCSLPLPREAEQISIDASDLHPEPGNQGDFVLHATLRNRAGYPQAYPHVELSLTDAADKALVRRVFSPEEWAPEPARSAEGFAPGGLAELALAFNAAGVPALGYRVYAFYP